MCIFLYKKPKKEFPIKYIREGLSEEMHESEIDSTKKGKRHTKKHKFSEHVKTRAGQRKAK